MSPPRAAGGFTLMEVLIAMAILAILAATALPAYTQYVQRSHRNDARLALMRAAQWMERLRSEQGGYVDAAGAAPSLPADVRQSPVPGSGKAQYVIALAASGPSAYRLTATPAAGGMMTKDGCGALSIAQDGQLGRSGTTPLEQCWTR